MIPALVSFSIPNIYWDHPRVCNAVFRSNIQTSKLNIWVGCKKVGLKGKIQTLPAALTMILTTAMWMR
jgi:hypothetical protein